MKCAAPRMTARLDRLLRRAACLLSSRSFNALFEAGFCGKSGSTRRSPAEHQGCGITAESESSLFVRLIEKITDDGSERASQDEGCPKQNHARNARKAVENGVTRSKPPKTAAAPT